MKDYHNIRDNDLCFVYINLNFSDGVGGVDYLVVTDKKFSIFVNEYILLL